MKRLIFLTVFFSMVFATMAQTRLSMRIWKDGVASKYVLEEIDSVMFVEDVFIPDNVVATKNNQSFHNIPKFSDISRPSTIF